MLRGLALYKVSSMTVKTIDTLVPDIYNLFDPEVDHKCSEDNLNELAENMKDLFRSRLRSQGLPKSALRFSALGRPDRQIWLEDRNIKNVKAGGASVKGGMPLKNYVKFLYGDLVEQMLLFLAKEAGHTVEQEQGEVEVLGVKGHIDAVIDGVVVDVKSASPFGYKKFESNSIEQDDPFGYVAQLAGYANVLTPGKPAAWLANDKVGGDLCLSTLNTPIIKHYKPEERITHLKEVLASDDIPAPCYLPEPEGKSGNMKLPTGCSYCAFKFQCYPNARVFLYSSGPKFLTTVAKEPNVPEIVFGE